MTPLFTEIPRIAGGRLTLRALTGADAPGLQDLMDSPRVYRYEPSFLFERGFSDAREVIARLYKECFRESIILGIFMDAGFCGLIELYGHRPPIHKISVGYRLREAFWGRGVATEALGLMVDYLYGQTDTEIITASTMVQNRASARVLTKNGFDLVNAAVGEDWGFDEPTLADKWIR